MAVEHTDFAGLTVIPPGESIYADGWSFFARNPRVIDRLLQVGAVSHRHDGAPVLPGPVAAPVVTTQDVDGVLPAGVTYRVGYTLLDGQGGETLLSPVAQVTTPDPLDPPGAIAAVMDNAAGTLRIGTYRYAITVLDGQGGETPLGAYVEIARQPGPASAQAQLTGLQDAAVAVGGAGWRLYRSRDGGRWTYLTQGNAAAVTDDGTLCPDCDQAPPDAFTNTTRQTNKLTIHIPALPADAASYRVYVSRSEAFASPALVEARFDDGDVDVEFASNALLPGAPPPVATTIPGADKIHLDEILDLRWLAPVADVADLPAAPTDGDARVVLNPDPKVYVAKGGDWVATAGGGGAGAVLAGRAGDYYGMADTLTFSPGPGVDIVANGPGGGVTGEVIIGIASQSANWRPPVATQGDLPAGNHGDARITLDDGKMYVVLGPNAGVPADWSPIVGAAPAGGAAHDILDEGVLMTARTRLDFVGAGVSVADDAGTDRTVVTIDGGGGVGDSGITVQNAAEELAIPDTGALTYSSLLHVAESKIIGTDTDYPELWIWLEHPFLSQLIVRLVAPGGTFYDVVFHDGPDDGLGSGWSEDTRAVVSPYAPLVMNFASPNFTGRVKPSDANSDTPWSGLIGKDIAGDWKLMLIDQTSGNAGTLHAWGLHFYDGMTPTGDVDAAKVTLHEGNQFGPVRVELEAVNTVATPPNAPKYALRVTITDDDGIEHVVDVNPYVTDVPRTIVAASANVDNTKNVYISAGAHRAHLDYEGAGNAFGAVLAAALQASMRPIAAVELWVPYRTPVEDGAGALQYGEFWTVAINGVVTRTPNDGLVSAPDLRAHISWPIA